MERENAIQLGMAERGQRIIGKAGNTYIVLKQLQSQGQTMVISDNLMAENVVFDQNTTNYAESSLKTRIEEIILPIIVADFGIDNIAEHEVDLTTVDMHRDFGTCMCRVRPLTFDEAEEFDNLLIKEDLPEWYWTCTPCSTSKPDWEYDVSVVSPFGMLYGDLDFGVRPFCILKSNIFVSLKV